MERPERKIRLINAFVVLLTVCFIVMKVAGVITWGWLVCFSPFLILLVFDLVVATAVVLFGTHFYCKTELKGKLDDKLKALRKKKN